MDWSIISQLIGSLGFPIFACVALYVRMEKQDENHKEEMEKLNESLNNNTLALVKLTEKLEVK